MTTAQTVISGIVTAPPEQRFTSNNTAVTVFTVQVTQPSRRAGQPDEFFTMKVTCWRQLAEQAMQLQQGQAVLLNGKLMMQTVTTPDGQNRKQFEVEASGIQILPGVPVELNAAAPVQPGQGMPQQPMTPQQPMQQQPMQPAPTHQTAGAAAMTPPQQPMAPAQQARPNSLSDLTSEDFLMSEEEIPF